MEEVKVEKTEEATGESSAAPAAGGAAKVGTIGTASSAAAAAGCKIQDASGKQSAALEDKTGGDGVHWTTDASVALPLKVRKEGPGAEKPRTVIEVFEATVAKYPTKAAMCVEKDDKWTTVTYKEYHDMVTGVAKSLIHLDVPAHVGICIIGFNSPEWFAADLGAIYAGAIATGIYTTNGPEACHYILEHCAAPVCFVENEAQLAKIVAVRDRLPNLKAIVMWKGTVPADSGDSVYTWADFIKLGADVGEDKLKARIEAQDPGHCCSLIYTSGTTGPPKAVMISHDNLTWTANTTNELLGNSSEDHCVSYLPLSHIAAQMLDIHSPIMTGATVHFARPDALKGSLGATLKHVRPTVFLGVPRVWEKMQEKIKSVGAKNTGLKKSIATWSKKKGLEGGYAEQKGKSKGFGFSIANKLVFSKVKAQIGLDRCRVQATAAAPIAKDTLEFFLSLGVPVFEIYGMSECTGPQTISMPGNYKTGSCGRSIPGTDMKLDDMDKEGNGEIIYRGRHVFMGYLKNPEASGATIDELGFLHSGDVGRTDEGGYLTISGRIKELIITAGGENVPPVLIEDNIKEALPIVSNVMVIGDKRKFLSCVITLRSELQEDGEPDEKLTPAVIKAIADAGGKATTVPEAQNDPVVAKMIDAGLAASNKKATSNAQMVRKFTILARDFSLGQDVLTPTMKLKRRIVNMLYEKEIEAMYAE